MSTPNLTDILTHQFIYPLWNERDFSVIEKFIAPDAVIRTTFTTGKGPETLKKSVEDTFLAFPTFKLTLEEIIQQSNRVTYKWTANVEHRGNILGIEPSGKAMVFQGIVFGEIEDEKIVKYHSFSNIPQTLYSHIEHSKDTFPKEAILLNHENYETEICDLIFTIVKTTGVRLTRREIECLYFWIKGYAIKETARQLGDISSKTVQVFRDKIKKKFQVYSFRALVDLLQKHGLMKFFL